MPTEPQKKIRKHWKIYRGNLQHADMGNEVYWSASESGIKKMLRDARALDPEKYARAGDYNAIYIEPTKRGVVDWLQRNFNYDNG